MDPLKSDPDIVQSESLEQILRGCFQIRFGRYMDEAVELRLGIRRKRRRATASNRGPPFWDCATKT